jgi:hypothetical protein
MHVARMLKPAPKLPELQQEPDDPDTTAIVDNIVQTRKERDQLRLDVRRHEATIAELTREIEFLRARLDEAHHDRDFYHARYITLHTRMSDISHLIINGMQVAAREAAAAGIEDPLRLNAEPVDLDEQARLKELAATLGANNRDDREQERA